MFSLQLQSIHNRKVIHVLPSSGFNHTFHSTFYYLKITESSRDLLHE